MKTGSSSWSSTQRASATITASSTVSPTSTGTSSRTMSTSMSPSTFPPSLSFDASSSKSVSLSESRTINASLTISSTITNTSSGSNSKSLILPLTASDTNSLLNSSLTSTHTTTNSPLPCHSLMTIRPSQVRVVFSSLTLPIPTSTNTSITSYTTLGYQNQSSTTSSVDATLPVGALSIDRRTLMYGWDNGGPPMLVANLTIQAPAQLALGLRVKNITLNDNLTLQHTYPYYGDSWHVVTIAPTPEYGWVAVSLWQPTTIILDAHLTCGATIFALLL